MDYILLGVILLFLTISIGMKEGYLDSESSPLQCMTSTLDGGTYCIRDRVNREGAVELLAKITKKMKTLVAYTHESEPYNEIGRRLVRKFNPDKISEILPTSEYTAYSENKGKTIAFCLNKKKEDNEQFIDENTLTFAAIHELAHIATLSVGHTNDFWKNFKYLLEKAVQLKLYDPIDYSKENMEYCGMTLNTNPYFT